MRSVECGICPNSHVYNERTVPIIIAGCIGVCLTTLVTWKLPGCLDVLAPPLLMSHRVVPFATCLNRKT